jgi:hypothetical protein
VEEEVLVAGEGGIVVALVERVVERVDDGVDDERDHDREDGELLAPRLDGLAVELKAEHAGHEVGVGAFALAAAELGLDDEAVVEAAGHVREGEAAEVEVEAHRAVLAPRRGGPGDEAGREEEAGDVRVGRLLRPEVERHEERERGDELPVVVRLLEEEEERVAQGDLVGCELPAALGRAVLPGAVRLAVEPDTEAGVAGKHEERDQGEEQGGHGARPRSKPGANAPAGPSPRQIRPIPKACALGGGVEAAARRPLSAGRSSFLRLRSLTHRAAQQPMEHLYLQNSSGNVLTAASIGSAALLLGCAPLPEPPRRS